MNQQSSPIEQLNLAAIEFAKKKLVFDTAFRPYNDEMYAAFIAGSQWQARQVEQPKNEPTPVKGDDGFVEYMLGARDEFVIAIKNQERSNYLLTAVGSFLICFDQMRERLSTKAAPKGDAETVGQILKAAIALHELNPDVVEKGIDLPKGILTKLMNDEFYTNSVPVVLFKNLLVSLHIPFSKIEPAMIPTFRTVLSKETPATIKKKPHGYTLWENEESVQKYTKHLKEIMTPAPKAAPKGDGVLSAKEIMETINPKEGWAWSSKMIEQVAEQYASQFAAPQAVKWVQAKAFEALVISVEGWQLISDNGNLKVLYDTFKETLQSILDKGSTDKKTK